MTTLLLEHLMYRALLTEASRFEFLLKTYEKKIAAKYEASPNAVNVVHDIESRPGETISAKVLQYIMGHDPSRNQQFSQWLVNVWLRNGLQLEDLERATQYLNVFQAAKSRLEKKDINQYKTLPELYNVLRPFIEDDVAVSTNAEQRREDKKMHQEAKVILDNAKFKIVIPLTQDASCYFGRNTQWCTAATIGQNYFTNYNNRGPLYIILDKANNKRWQFFFSEDGRRDEFRSEDDESIEKNIGEFMRAYPEVINAIGRDKFKSYFSKAGLAWMNPEDYADIPMASLAALVHSKADMERVPEKIRKSFDFLYAIPGAVSPLNFNILAKYITPEAAGNTSFVLQCFEVYEAKKCFKVFKPEHYQPILDDIVQSDYWLVAKTFNDFPDVEKTQDRCNIVSSKMADHGDHTAFREIPKDRWSETVTSNYWDALAKDSKSHISDIPEKHHTLNILTRCFKRFPTDLAKSKDVLDRFPTWLSSATSTFTVGQVNDILTHAPREHLTEDICATFIRRFQGSYFPTENILTRFPSDSLTKEAVDILIRKYLMPFAKLPERFRTDLSIMTEVVKREKNIRNIPNRYFTNRLLKAISGEYGILKKLNSELLTDELILLAISKMSYTSIYDDVPRSKRSPTVMAEFVKRGDVPVKEIPKNLVTMAAVVKRVYRHQKELKDTPKHLWNEQFVINVLKENVSDLDSVPDSLLTPAVFDAFMASTGRSYGSDPYAKTFTRFPESSWTKKSLPIAIARGYVKPRFENFPPEKISEDAAARIVAKDKDELAKLPPQYDVESFYTKAVALNPRVLSVVDRSKMTTAVCSVALDHAYYRDQMRLLPVENFGLDEWMKAVGISHSLKEVPRKFRTPKLVHAAITRDETTLRMIKDPAAFLQKHDLALTRTGWKDARYEENGLIFKRNGTPVSIASIGREPLMENTEVAMITAKSGPRYYLYVKGKLVVRFYLDKNGIQMPTEVETAKKYTNQIIKMAETYFRDESIPGLAKVHIYKRRGQIVTEQSLDREAIGNMEWSEVSHGDYILFTGWVGNKAIIRIFKSKSKGGWGYSSKWSVSSISIDDQKKCAVRSGDIATFITDKKLNGDLNKLKQIGIFNTGDTRYSVRDKKIIQDGEFSVWRGFGTFSVWNKDRLVATMITKVNGSLGQIKYPTHSRWDKPEDSLKDRVEEMIGKAMEAQAPKLAAQAERELARRKKARIQERKEKIRIEKRRDILRRVAEEYLNLEDPNMPWTVEQVRNAVEGAGRELIEAYIGKFRELITAYHNRQE